MPAAARSHDHQHHRLASKRSPERAVCHHWQGWYLEVLECTGTVVRHPDMPHKHVETITKLTQQPPIT